MHAVPVEAVAGLVAAAQRISSQECERYHHNHSLLRKWERGEFSQIQQTTCSMCSDPTFQERGAEPVRLGTLAPRLNKQHVI
eukprot:776560-Amphidinium_carterae.1